MRGGCLGAAMLHLGAGLGGAVVPDAVLPEEAIELGGRAGEGALDLAEVDDERRRPRLRRPLDAAQSVPKRASVFAPLRRGEVQVVVALATLYLYERGRLVDGGHGQDAAVEDFAEFLRRCRVGDLDGVVAGVGGVAREVRAVLEALLLGVHGREGDGHGVIPRLQAASDERLAGRSATG